MLSSSKLFTSLCLLITFPLLLQSAFGGDPLISHFCYGRPGNLSGAHDPYETYLNNLFGNLSYQAPSTGFAMMSLGERPNLAYGLALCRGDVSSSDCKTCIAKARSEVRKLCPTDTGAIIWYDYCLLKYSDDDFFGQIDYDSNFSMWNTGYVEDPILFNHKTQKLLSKLAREAYKDPNLYATGEMKEEGSTKVYGLTQCTRDISEENCQKCLEGMIKEIPDCCYGRKGGRILGGSCNIRYEIYPFVKA